MFQTDTDIFQYFVAQLLYLSNGSHPDTQKEVSFLCTIVRESYTDDYKNLERLMKYIQGNIGLTLIFSIKPPGNIKWNVDAAFAVHKDMRRHTD